MIKHLMQMLVALYPQLPDRESWESIKIVIEMPDDKSLYAVNGARYDEKSNSVIIEVA